MNKTDLIQKVKAIEGLNQDERAYLVNLVNTKKKYGLVWEDKPEEVEEQLRENLPVLKEVKDKAIINGEEHPNHILIEGDNLHALTALTFTHEGKIDVIYIDPPYNTGKKTEFKYNDKYVDEEDSFRHSKWLSFMSKRLKIAHDLLADDGVLIVSIDDHEVAQLKMVCDEIFNSSPNPKASNQIGFLIWDLGTGTSAGHFTRTNEFILVYVKNKRLLKNFSGGEGIIDDRAQKKIGVKNPATPFTFLKGTKFIAEDGFELKGSWGGTEKTTLTEGKMVCENGKLKYDVTLNAGWTQKKQMESFFAGDDTIDSKGQKIIEFYFRENGKIYCKKDRSRVNPPSVLRDVATTKQGSSLLKSMFNGEEPIQFVKPVQLIQYFLNLLPEKHTILDFFAGSGTTLHATMALNAEDGGNRQCILVTNNENNICEEVTYERNRRVIQGYTNAKGIEVEGLTNNNLRYYKSEFVSNERSEVNRRKLTQLSTELICIKEDCSKDLTSETGFSEKACNIFTNGQGKYLIVVYHSRNLTDVFEHLVEYIKTLDTKEKVRLYGFSPEKETLLAEFIEVEDKIEAIPIPEAIYNAYKAVTRTLMLDRNYSETTNESYLVEDEGSPTIISGEGE
jgi:adenine-specific DNA-methyltransferase